MTSRTWTNDGGIAISAANLNSLENDIDKALGVPDAALATRVGAGDTKTALDATYTPRWKPNTAYTSGQQVVLPDNQIGSAKSAFTTSSTYDASKWTLLSAVDIVTSATAIAEVVTRVNYITNPSTETNTTRWTMNNAAGATTVAPWGQGAPGAGSSSFRATVTTQPTGAGFGPMVTNPAGTIAGASGDTVSAGVWVYASVACTMFISLVAYSGTTQVIGLSGADVSVQPNSWTQIKIEGIQVNGVYDNVRLWPQVRQATIGSFVVGSTLAYDAAQFERTPTLGAYFDGSSAAVGTTTYRWTGTPHASTSYEMSNANLAKRTPAGTLEVSTPTGYSDATPKSYVDNRTSASVKDFGAVGDGVADDTAAVQAFFDYLAATGRTGTAPAAGMYRLTSFVNLVAPAKPFIFNGNGATFVADFAANVSVFYVKNAANTVFENFTIKGVNSATVGHGMNLSNCTDCTTRNITVTGWGSTAIMFMWDDGLPGISTGNRIISCTARCTDGKARNGFMLENSSSSHIIDCNVFDLDPLGDPSFGLQMKNGCVNCSIIGGSVDGARAGVAFGTTTDLIAVGLVVSGVTVRNCLEGVMIGMSYGHRVDMTIDMNNNVFCEYGVYVASSMSSYGVYDVTVLNIPDSALAVMVKTTGNTVNLTMNQIGAARLAEFISGSSYNTVNVLAIGGKSDLSILQVPVLDSGTGNKVTFPSNIGGLHSNNNGTSVMRFSSPTDTGTYIQNNHATGAWTLRSLGVDVMTATPTAVYHAGATGLADLGTLGRKWKNVYANEGVFGAAFYFGSVNSVSHTTGSGSPEGVVTAPVGSEYVNTAGTAGAIKYAKKSGTGNTGWVAIW